VNCRSRARNSAGSGRGTTFTTPGSGRKRVQHPEVGELDLRYEVLTAPSEPDMLMSFLLAVPARRPRAAYCCSPAGTSPDAAVAPPPPRPIAVGDHTLLHRCGEEDLPCGVDSVGFSLPCRESAPTVAQSAARPRNRTRNPTMPTTAAAPSPLRPSATSAVRRRARIADGFAVRRLNAVRLNQVMRVRIMALSFLNDG
jgi:hypothetical protein